ncbi:MAG: acyl carrier protein [bacterium]|nr:acyl carrier protein [bacterium]
MTRDQVKEIVLNIISVVAPDADLSGVKSDVRLRDQLEMDSMDFLDIVMELRKRYKIEVPKEDYQQLASLDSCAEYLTPRLQEVAVS